MLQMVASRHVRARQNNDRLDGLFRAAVAAMGEPARTTLTADEVGPMFAATGWREVPTAERPAGDRARSVGLVVAEPV